MHELSLFFRENRDYRFLQRRIYPDCVFVEVIKQLDIIANYFYKKFE